VNGAISQLGRLWRRDVSVTGYRRMVYSAVFWLYLVVATGAVVRLTGSGMGCDNWPRCGELPVPTQAKTYHPIIEFSNRMIALVAILFAIAMWLAARRTASLPRWVVRVSGLVALGTVAQIPLGGITVLTGLHPVAVMSHFLLTIVMLAVAIYLALEARRQEYGAVAPLVPLVVRRLGLVMLLAGTVLVVTGAVSTASGPHPGASNDVRRLFTVEGTVYVHVRATAVYGVVFAVLIAALVWRRATASRLLLSALGLLVLLGGQMAVGEVQYREGLPAWQVLIHVAISGAIWSWTAWLVGALWRPSALLVRPLPLPLGRLLGRAAAADA
jgi:cytochrome c oxidase assembly protein subunit 15